MVFALRGLLGMCIIEVLQRLLPKCNDNTGCWPERILVVKCLYCADCAHREQVFPSGVMGGRDGAFVTRCRRVSIHPIFYRTADSCAQAFDARRQNMMRHSCVSLLSFFAVVSSRSVLTDSLYGRVAAHQDYTLNLQPPQETPQDIEESLDATMKAEDQQRMLSDHEFEEAKQSMITAEKQRIRDMVRSAFAA